MSWWRSKRFIRSMFYVLFATACVGLAAVSLISYRNTITPQGIIIHHTAIPPLPNNRIIDVNYLDEIHRQRGYGTFYWGRFYHVGYHYVILPDGEIQQGRPERCQGAHAASHNSYLGICLIGNFSSRNNPHGDRGLAEPTAAQVDALVGLSRQLQRRYGFAPQNVLGHSQVNQNTECPGDRFPLGEIQRLLQIR